MKTYMRIHTLSLAVTLLFGLIAQVTAQNQPSGGMMRFPDVSADHIVFVYSDDLWIVDRDGGVATPLASPKGAERFPRFSPDGKTVATGHLDGTIAIRPLQPN